MKIGELIYNAAIKNGIAIDHAGLKAILALTTEVDKDIETAVEGLMSIDGAKNNGKLKAHFISQFADGQDKRLYERLEALGLPKDQLDPIKTEFDSRKKVDLAIDKLQDMIKEAKAAAKKDGGNADEDVKKYKDEIKKLNDSLADIKNQSLAKEKELSDKFELERISSLQESAFDKFAWSKHYDQSVRGPLSRIALNEELTKIGATVVRDANGKLKLVQSKDTSMDYFDSSNKSITFDELADRIMTDKKFKAVSPDPNEGGGQGIPPIQSGQGANGGGAGNQKSQSTNLVKDLLNRSMSDQDKIQN